MGLSSTAVGFKTIPNILPRIDQYAAVSGQIDVFGNLVSPDQITDWSFDIFTRRSFPGKYAKDINIRSEEYGSAKHVWEVNRMLFLPRLAMLYRNTGNVKYINLITRLISGWVEQNPYLTGINWYSNIEINVRLINWFFTWEIIEAEQLAEQFDWFKKFVNESWIPSIYQHCKFSFEHPSLHSSANNHLISEYAGLFIASSKWLFRESKSWNEYAKHGLEMEIERQHTMNGINREEAAEYIQFITDFFLIAMLVGDYTKNCFSRTYKIKLKIILKYISDFLTINGQFPKYGDEDDGRLVLLNENIHDNNFTSLLQAGTIYFNNPQFLNQHTAIDNKNHILFGTGKPVFGEQNIPKHKLKQSSFFPEDGHFIFRKQDEYGKEIYCHFDAAPIGYLSIAAHGHADALSFELHLDGQPFFVDPGTFCYHTDPSWRKYFVSTRAHNTIGIEGVDQATFIGPTLWLNHYKVYIKKFAISDDYEYVIAGHTGFKKHHLLHTRKLEFYKSSDKIIITDYLTNTANKTISLEMPFHLHPSVRCELNGHQALATFANRKVLVNLDKQMQWVVAEGLTDPCLGWYSERFYKKVPSPVIMGTMQSATTIELRTELVIQ